jgi:hypothetical protein
MLSIDPKMLPRLEEIEDDLLARRARAEHEAWLGEIEGIDLTLTFLRQKPVPPRSGRLCICWPPPSRRAGTCPR